jgi:hypothetical protein
MNKAVVTLNPEQLIVALQAIRDYGATLDRVLRERRSWDERLHRERSVTDQVLEQLSDAYARTPV